MDFISSMDEKLILQAVIFLWPKNLFPESKIKSESTDEVQANKHLFAGTGSDK